MVAIASPDQQAGTLVGTKITVAHLRIAMLTINKLPTTFVGVSKESRLSFQNIEKKTGYMWTERHDADGM